MVQSKNFEIYEIIENFVSPLTFSENGRTINSNIGEKIIIVDDEVWIKDWNAGIDKYSKPTYDATFVRINTKIFKKQ
jgi:hypothetical protein